MPRPSISSFPDSELLITRYLTAAESVTARVVTKLPLPITGTVIRVTRVGGANRSIRVDRPLVDIDVFGPDYASVIATAIQVQNELLFSLRNTTTQDGTVQNVTTVIGPHFLPDVNQDLVRYSATYEFHVHA